MAERDPLTGVLNRRSFDAALEAALPGTVALVLFDFNDFKIINDVWGHPVGDEVLRTVVRAADSVIRDADSLARIGGDEFALVAPGAGTTGVARLLDSLDEAIRDADVPTGVGPVLATFGWAVAPDDTSDATELLRLADDRLIERKRAIKALEYGLRES
jgi:diguanylate cyclase